ncbi:MAG: hypothetical protein KJ614_14595 [Gammaproteobacteria bacterium]|uniref:hypothetical protein n=1 Tax=Rhodoferax sp. TaxID=50421 RepID=UPI0017FCD318|nr:hypothetical protein [Rhodoferax sp.]MBU3900128.1 hypothetical protein [Gammaproteobacteria bacterium]MBA3059802.1 hypothetical protein [Rhodoferax sp.]MBU3998755.1 hypothetical protein [Gammaproteobacteria bacterium]MBU4018312.1 hypothetical protein [Gammaproteobacteria bacterium]MBU4082166.1 hypothetical protein [Gammaproteobacteria bacterium]
MAIDFFSFDAPRLLGESATHPIEPLAARPGVLLRLAGMSLQRCRAYPVTPPAAHSGASN